MSFSNRLEVRVLNPFTKQLGKIAAIAAVFLALIPAARPAGGSISKETQLKLLKLEEARVSLVHAMENEQKYLDDWLNLKNLLQEDVVTGKEVTEAEAEKNEATQKLELAIVDLSKTYLSFLQEATHLTVTDAYQFIDQNNERHANMTIANTSDIGLANEAYGTLAATYKELDGYLAQRNKKLTAYMEDLKKRLDKQKDYVNSRSSVTESERKKLSNLEAEADELSREIKDFGKKLSANKISKKDIAGLMTIEDLYVSVTVGGVSVCMPFESRIAKLPYNGTNTLDFKLTQEVDQVTINLNYQNVKDQRNVKLEKRQLEDVVRVSSMQFAQEGQLNTWVEYDLKLERMAEDEKTFMMEVVNLPARYKYEFTSQGNKLSRVKFSQGVSVQSLSLKVLVPEKLSGEFIKKPVSFYVIVGEDASVSALRDMAREGGADSVGPNDFKALKVGYEILEITPRGVGEMELSFSNLYNEIKVGDKVADKFTLKNTGSAKLTNIEFKVEKPSNDWQVNIKPPEIDSIDQKKDKDLEFDIVPPKNVEVGKYEIKIKAKCDFEGSAVETDQKTIVVQIYAKANLTTNIIIVVVIVIAVLGIAIFTIKLSRR